MSGLMLVYVLGCKYRPTARDLLVFAPVYDDAICMSTYLRFFDMHWRTLLWQVR